MSYILHDPTIFDIQLSGQVYDDSSDSDESLAGDEYLNTRDIYYLCVGNKMYEGNFVPIRWMVSNGITDEYSASNAASVGNLKCLQYLHENRYEWDSLTCYQAAFNGHLDCLIYAHENGCPWYEDVCTLSAQNGHLDCLIYAHEEGCPWNWNTCYQAARNGHLDCLKYAHMQGCPWNWITCNVAAAGGHLACRSRN